MPPGLSIARMYKNVFVCVCVCVLILATYQYQSLHSRGKVWTFVGCEDIWAGLHSFKGLFEEEDLVLTLGLELNFRLG